MSNPSATQFTLSSSTPDMSASRMTSLNRQGNSHPTTPSLNPNKLTPPTSLSRTLSHHSPRPSNHASPASNLNRTPASPPSQRSPVTPSPFAPSFMNSPASLSLDLKNISAISPRSDRLSTFDTYNRFPSLLAAEDAALDTLIFPNTPPQNQPASKAHASLKSHKSDRLYESGTLSPGARLYDKEFDLISEFTHIDYKNSDFFSKPDKSKRQRAPLLRKWITYIRGFPVIVKVALVSVLLASILGLVFLILWLDSAIIIDFKDLRIRNGTIYQASIAISTPFDSQVQISDFRVSARGQGRTLITLALDQGTVLAPRAVNSFNIAVNQDGPNYFDQLCPSSVVTPRIAITFRGTVKLIGWRSIYASVPIESKFSDIPCPRPA